MVLEPTDHLKPNKLPPDLPTKLRITLIGSGNLATSLGPALLKAGHEVREVYSRTAAHAAALAGKLGASPLSDLHTLSPGSDLYLISVKDEALPEVARTLKVTGAVTAHTAGSFPMDLLKESSSAYGVFYPLQTFSRYKELDFKEIPVCIEANNEVSKRVLTTLATSISTRVSGLDSTQRKALHIAAVFACNFSNHLYTIAHNILEKHQLPFDLVRPLIAETAAKAQTSDPRHAQTGPAARNDQAVIQDHLRQLATDPDLQKIYKLLSQHILRSRK